MLEGWQGALSISSSVFRFFRFNPIQTGGGGLLRPASTLNLRNFVTVYASATKLCDFS